MNRIKGAVRMNIRIDSGKKRARLKIRTSTPLICRTRGQSMLEDKLIRTHNFHKTAKTLIWSLGLVCILIAAGCGAQEPLQAGPIATARVAVAQPTPSARIPTQINPAAATLTQLPALAATLTPAAFQTLTSTPANSTLEATPALPDQVASLATGAEYIVYSDQDAISRQYEIWGLEPETAQSFLLMTYFDRLWSLKRSPSGDQWIVGSRSTLFLAKSDGAEMEVIFHDPRYVYFSVDWSSETEIIADAWFDLSDKPDTYRINSESGRVEKIVIPGIYYVLGLCIEDNVWISRDSVNKTLVTVDQDGNLNPILSEYMVSIDLFYNRIQFISGTDQFVFVGSGGGLDDYTLMISSLSDPEVVTLFEPGEGEYNLYFQVSPGGEQVGVVFQTDEGNYIVVIDLATGELIHKWVFPYEIGTIHFVWSPDAKQIALPYFEEGNSSESDIDRGIQLMDLATGTTRAILKQDVINFEWVRIE